MIPEDAYFQSKDWKKIFIVLWCFFLTYGISQDIFDWQFHTYIVLEKTPVVDLDSRDGNFYPVQSRNRSMVFEKNEKVLLQSEKDIHGVRYGYVKKRIWSRTSKWGYVKKSLLEKHRSLLEKILGWSSKK